MTVIDTGTTDLLAEVADGVALVTMNRPERRNALSDAMLRALGAVLARVEADDDVRCVVLTGAGGGFCAGGDVKGMADSPGGASGASGGTLQSAVERQRANQRATSGRLHQMATPTIAMIGGPAAGAGLSLALACDLRYIAADTVLTTAFARVGLSGDYGGAWFLARLVGPSRAAELFWLPERISAAEAERLGIVNAVFDAAALDHEVMAIARRIAAGPTVAMRSMKDNVNRALSSELGEFMDAEVALHIASALTDDHREATRAFVEKREPRFSGR